MKTRTKMLAGLILLSTGTIMQTAAQVRHTPVFDSFDYSYENFHDNFSYTYVDDNGQEVTVPLTTPATTPAAIKALLKEVYTNTEIPGRTWTYDDFFVSYVPSAKAQEVYGLENIDYQPAQEGVTCLLVEGIDNDDALIPGEHCIDRIKCVTLITSRVAIDDNASSEGPGYLFNVNKPLKKFYFITKGKSRDTNVEPLFNLFEEYSPNDGANDLVPHDVYSALRNGKAFYVNHDCSSVVRNRGHWMVMETTESGAPVSISLSIFIPYMRSYDDTVLGTGHEIFTWYDPQRQPFMYRYTIGLEAVATPSEGNPGVYDVTLRWNSNFRKYFTTGNKGEFYAYPIVGGAMAQEPVVFSSSPQEGYTTIMSDGKVLSNSPGTVIATYQVEANASGRFISYIVGGQPEGLGAGYTYSNVAKVYIPGYDDEESFVIDLVGTETSDFSPLDRVNTYDNYLSVTNRTDDKAIKEVDLAEGSRFDVLRTVTRTNRHTPVADITVDAITQSDADDTTYYDLTLSYADRRPSQKLSWKSYGSSAPVMNAEGEDNYTLVELNDCFSVEVPDDNSHPDQYSYTVCLNYDDMTDTAEKTSNIVDVHIYKSAVEVLPHTYSYDEIMEDNDRSLPIDGYDVALLVTNHPHIEGYRVRYANSDDEGNADVIAVIQNNAGTFSVSLRDRNGELVDIDRSVTVPSGKTGIIYFPLKSYHIPRHDDLLVDVCVTPSDLSFDPSRPFNTYGTPPTTPGRLPSVEISNADMVRVTNNKFANRITRKTIYTDIDDVSPNDFTVEGVSHYSIWRSVNDGDMEIVHDGTVDMPFNSSDLSAGEYLNNDNTGMKHTDSFTDETQMSKAEYIVRSYIAVTPNKDINPGMQRSRSLTQTRYMIAEDNRNTVLSNPTTGIEDVDIADASAIKAISGTTVTIIGTGPISIFTIDGTLVAEISDGQSSRTVTNLAPGLYVASNASGVAKFVKK